MNHLSAHEDWSRLFRSHPGLYYVPLRSFVDKRWAAAERFGAVQSDLSVAARVFGASLLHVLTHGRRVELAQMAGAYRLTLERNAVSPHEGLWAIALSTEDGRRLFNLSFTFTAVSTVLIGSVQGMTSQTVDAIDHIRVLTKECHGLRPPHLLVNVLKMLASSWSMQTVKGIDPAHQVKRRANASKQGFSFDYCALWTECGGVQDAHQYWELPIDWSVRDLSDVPSKKRSMYRKRGEWLSVLSQQIPRSLDSVTIRQLLR